MIILQIGIIVIIITITTDVVTLDLILLEDSNILVNLFPNIIEKKRAHLVIIKIFMLQ